jgi:capsular polysaccharide biosynthesis protein
MSGRQGKEPVVDRGAPPSEQSVVTIGQFLAILRRRFRVVLVATTIGALCGAALLHGSPKTYEATAVVLVTPTSPSQDLSSVSNVTESRIVTSTSVVRGAAQRLNYEGTTTSLARHVSVASPLNSQLLNITFAASDAPRAAEGANAFANAYLAYRRRIAQRDLALQADIVESRAARLQRTLQTLQASGSDSERASIRNQIQQLQRRLNAYETSIVTPGHVVGPAVVPGSPTSPKGTLYLIGGVLMGVFVGAGLAVMRDRKDDRIQDFTTLELSLGVPVVAESTAFEQDGSPVLPAALAAQRGADADAYRSLAAALISSPSRTRVVLLCGAGVENFTAAPLNLACTFALQGLRTVLAGPHHALEPAFDVPRLAAAFDDGLDGQLTSTKLPSLRLLPLGDEVVLGATLRANEDRLSEIVEAADMVVIDGVNVELSSTSTRLAILTEEAVLVASAGRTTQTDVDRTVRQLAQVGATVVGAILLDPPNPLKTWARKVRRAGGQGSAESQQQPPRQRRDAVVVLGAKRLDRIKQNWLRNGVPEETEESAPDQVSTSNRPGA